jgi:hypothetical protein
VVNEAKTSSLTPAKGRPSRRGRQIYLQIIVAVVILSCGIVIGSGTALLHFKDRIGPGRRPPIEVIIDDMRTRYGLTEEQAKEVEDILGKSRQTVHALFEEFGQKIEAEFQKLSLEMKDVLSPEQYERWERDFKARREHYRRPGPRGHGPRRGPPDRPDAERPDFPREPNCGVE